MSMYKGQARWTKEQVIFACQVCIAAALDRIDSCLPPCTPADEYDAARFDDWIRSACETAGMGLGIIFAQLNDQGEGLAICDALSIIGFEKVVEGFIDARLHDDKAPEPDSRRLAELFVNKTFGPVWFADR